MTATDTPPETHDGTTTATTSVLTPYRGQPVMAAGVAIPNAAGGLHDALKVDPIELDLGATVYVVLKCEVRPPSYDPIDKDNYRGPLKLVNRLHAVEGTFVDEGLVERHLAEQRKRIAEAKQREADGVDDRQLTIDDADGPRGGEPQTVGQLAEDVLDIAQQLEDGANVRDTRTKELDNPTDYTVDDLRSLAGEYEIKGRSKMTRTELVDAIVEHEYEAGHLGDDGGDA